MDFLRKIVSFTLGFSNMSRFPYALAVLDCGHVTDVKLRPRIGACYKCKREQPMPIDGSIRYCCGTSHFTMVGTYPDPHNAADRITQIGDVVECKDCETEVKQIAWLRALDKSTVLLSRFRHGGYHFYRHDPTSPSGKFLIGSVGASKAIEAVLNELRYAPLSPTEGLREDVAR